MDKYVGKKLDGRYELHEVIGVGGMAVVYKAFDCIENKIVAVKILKDEFARNEEFLRRFKNESKAIAVLSHQNIVKVFDVSFGDAIQYIVMEYIDGITLKEYIEQQGSLRWKDAVYLAIQVLRALQHAHDKGIVHRDVKPQNIMLLRDGTVKVADFGIARFARSEQKTITDKAIGSVHYISPEQARGDVTSEKADVYSVGIMLYEMLTGKLPFEAESAVSIAIMQLQNEPEKLTDINPSIPLGLEQITLHAMQKDTLKRYKSAAEMLRDLEEFRRSPDITFDYNTYFVDDSPTKYVSDLSDNEIEDFDNLDEEEENEKSPVMPILLGIVGAFIVAAIGFVLLWWNSGGQKAEIIECPNFVGMDYNEMVESGKYSDYTFTTPVSEHNSAPAGQIFSQSKTAGSSIKKTQKITLYVSLGPKLISIPNVIDFEKDRAVKIIKEAGLVPNVLPPEYNDNYEAGRVCYVNPVVDAQVESGATIDIHISKGPDVQKVEVGNYLNKQRETATKEIEEKGFKVNVVEVHSEKPAGYVVKQSPEHTVGSVARGTTITIEVSNGIPQYTMNVNFKLPNNLIESEIVSIKTWFNNELINTSETSVKANGQQFTVPVTTIKTSGKLYIEFVQNLNISGTVKEIKYYYCTIDCDFKNSTVKKITVTDDAKKYMLDDKVESKEQ